MKSLIIRMEATYNTMAEVSEIITKVQVIIEVSQLRYEEIAKQQDKLVLWQ